MTHAFPPAPDSLVASLVAAVIGLALLLAPLWPRVRAWWREEGDE